MARTAALLLLALALLAVGERGLRAAYGRFWAPTGDARWIWAQPAEPPGGESADDRTEGAGGAAFFTFRDFELDGFPGRARISCRADEEYFLYVNGVLVGAGSYRDGGPLDSYEIGYLLRPGANRLAAELRSGRGFGGFLLDLEIDGRERLRLGTGDTWRVARAYTDTLLLPEGEIPATEPAFVWSTPPTGRWGVPRFGGVSPGFEELIDSDRIRHAPRALSERTGGGWRGLAPPDVSSPPLGRSVTFDFGREAIGYPNVVFGRKEGALALVYAGVEPPDPEHDRPIAYLLNPEGRKSWSDTRPHRFRYLTVLATAEMVGARVLPVIPELARSALDAVKPPAGVFGLEPLELRPPVENEIRRELERLAGVAAGESL